MYALTPKISWMTNTAGAARPSAPSGIHRGRSMLPSSPHVTDSVRRVVMSLIVAHRLTPTEHPPPLGLQAVLLADFDYDLPAERIAQTPAMPRDSARLLVDQGSAAPLHRRFTDLGEFLEPGDLLVVNDTKVIPARLRLRRSSG